MAVAARHVFDDGSVKATSPIVLRGARATTVAGRLVRDAERGLSFDGHNVGTVVEGCYFGGCDIGVAIGTSVSQNDSELVIRECFFVGCAVGLWTGHNQTKNNTVVGCRFSQCDVAFRFEGAPPAVRDCGVWGKRLVEAPNNGTNRFVFSGLDSEALVDVGFFGVGVHGVKTPVVFDGCQLTFDYTGEPPEGWHLYSRSSLVQFRGCEFHGLVPADLSGPFIVDTELPILFDGCTFLDDTNGESPVQQLGTGAVLYRGCVARDLTEPSGHRLLGVP